MRTAGEVIVGLVEADMAVVTDTEQLKVRVARVGDHLVIGRAGILSIEIGAVGHMGVGDVDVHAIVEILAHEIVIALRVIVRKPAILIEVIGAYLGEIDVALLAPISELIVCPHGRRAGSKAEHAVGLQDDLSRDDICRLTAHIVVIFGFDDFHNASLLLCGMPYRASRRSNWTSCET